ncbi:MAG: hypothetical protein CMJ46_15065 [Planctomyces sp.]|nr:hypothetical protein [Planctomyces sp.]
MLRTNSISATVLGLLLCASLAQAGETSDRKPTPAERPVAKASNAPDTAPMITAPVTDMSIEELVTQARKSVVVVTFSGRDGQKLGVGSGFIIEPDGLIATNLHVIGDSRPISVHLANGKKYDVTEVRATDHTLDLALIKIDEENLPTLPVRFTNDIRDGEAIIALGNPLGLNHSVVKGVVSSQREVEGRNMLQLAIPIEQGNSGGPVINQQGEVIGLVTLKSLASENLGFAVPASDLKLLLDRPNPIPMSRWLTIGRLDENKWKELFGATWRQRSGRIQVEGSGKGFGGRALLLSTQEVPEPPYEVALRVKQDQKDGAAGLVFGADGEYQHYGFYPSGGRIRLSKFNGPDVLTWQVLQEIETPLLREDWNHLKVRVEEEGLICFLNGQPVIEMPRVKVSDGMAGLAKFRNTTAEFKQFQVAEEIPSDEPADEVRAAVLDLIKEAPQASWSSPQLTEDLLPHAPYTTSLLNQKAAQLEREAVQLRQLAHDVHRKRVESSFAELMTNEVPDLFAAALHIAWLDNEELDIEVYLNEVDRLAETLKARFDDTTTEAQKFEALNGFLFEELGFHGSRTNFYHRSNSYVNEVIDDREGLPISLSVLYAALGSRIGINIEGVGLPGKFVVRFVPGEGEPQLLDPFAGGKLLSRHDAEVIAIANSGQPLDESLFAPQSVRAIMTRMLRNLLNLAQAKEDEARMLNYMHLVITLNPDSAEDHWARALLAYRTERFDQASEDLDWLDAQSPPAINPRIVEQMREAIAIKQSRLNAED